MFVPIDSSDYATLVLKVNPRPKSGPHLDERQPLQTLYVNVRDLSRSMGNAPQRHFIVRAERRKQSPFHGPPAVKSYALADPLLLLAMPRRSLGNEAVNLLGAATQGGRFSLKVGNLTPQGYCLLGLKAMLIHSVALALRAPPPRAMKAASVALAQLTGRREWETGRYSLT